MKQLKVLETSETEWIDDLAKLLDESLYISSHMETELYYESPRYQRRGYDHERYYGVDPFTNRGYQETRYSSHLRDIRDRAERTLREYKQRMG